MNIGEDFKVEDIDLSGNLSLADQWILTRLNETISTVTELSDKYEFGEVGRALYNFIWDEFCDWYIGNEQDTYEWRGRISKANDAIST